MPSTPMKTPILNGVKNSLEERGGRNGSIFAG
jgi:hypothetical protein